MPTEKRHIYPAGTVNVETGNLAVKQDINYFSSNVQSATRSIIRMMEDMDKRFSQNQIYDGLAVSNGGATVDVASGTAKIGGRWVTIVATGLTAVIADDTYNVVLHVSGVSEVSTRDPSGGESINLFLEASGSWVDDDYKLVIGSAVISSSTVDSVIDRAKRQTNATIIKPYGTSTQVSIMTGTKPVYREAIRFTSDEILPFNKIVSEFPISGTAISGTTLDISGQTNLDNVSGSEISAASFRVGGEILDFTEFENLVGLDQPLDTTQSPSFIQLTATQTGSTIAPFIVTSPFVVTNLNADLLDGQHAPSGNIVGTTDVQVLQAKDLHDDDVLFVDNISPTKKFGFELSGLAVGTRRWTVPDFDDTFVGISGTQTLTNKTLTTPTIASFVNSTHDHVDAAGGGLIDLNDIVDTDKEITTLYPELIVFEGGGLSAGGQNSLPYIEIGQNETMTWRVRITKTGNVKWFLRAKFQGTNSSWDVAMGYQLLQPGDAFTSSFITHTDALNVTNSSDLFEFEIQSGSSTAVVAGDSMWLQFQTTETVLNIRVVQLYLQYV